MRSSLSRRQRVLRHSAFSIILYFIVGQLIFKRLPQWAGLIFVLNMITGCQIMDSFFKKMGTSVLFEAYTFVGCAKFLVMACAWPISALILRSQVEMYEKNRQQGMALANPSLTMKEEELKL